MRRVVVGCLAGLVLAGPAGAAGVARCADEFAAVRAAKSQLAADRQQGKLDAAGASAMRHEYSHLREEAQQRGKDLRFKVIQITKLEGKLERWCKGPGNETNPGCVSRRARMEAAVSSRDALQQRLGEIAARQSELYDQLIEAGRVEIADSQRIGADQDALVAARDALSVCRSA